MDLFLFISTSQKCSSIEVAPHNLRLAAMCDRQQQDSRTRQACTPDRKATGKWSYQEHQKFTELMNSHKDEWTLMAHHIPTRSVSQIRSHAQKVLNKENNDNTKIGKPCSSVQVRQLNEMAITRSRGLIVKPQASAPRSRNRVKPRGIQNPSAISRTGSEMDEEHEHIQNNRTEEDNTNQHVQLPSFVNMAEHIQSSRFRDQTQSEESFYLSRINEEIKSYSISNVNVLAMIGGSERYWKAKDDEENSMI